MSSFGIYTKTTIRSPVVRWILHARIRNESSNDVAFVGEDFIEVKEIGEDGHLQPVAVKTDFDASIRAATTFDNEEHVDSEDFLVKLEKEGSHSTIPGCPPQSLLLTLSSNDLTFVFLRAGDDGTLAFVQQAFPMPSFDRMLFQPGEHLAVEQNSRAIAVAACEREVVIYSTKPKGHIRYEMKKRSDSWCPIASARPLQIDGVIHQMDFLVPPSSDGDHIILLLIVSDHRHMKAIQIDWHYSSGPNRAQVQPGQPLESCPKVANLLIPLRDASFLLVTGDEVVRWKDILSGHASAVSLALPRSPPNNAGSSSGHPIWANWAKPRRSQAARRDKDTIYLVREDGLVFHLAIDARGAVHTSSAGSLGCHVGTAFASLGGEGDPDILAVAGEMSNGLVISIGLWRSMRRYGQLSREDTMSFDTNMVLPNWASLTDMISAEQFHSSRNRTRDMVNEFVTSGRHPYGSITEMRQGAEARLATYMQMDGLQNVTDAWALPDLTTGFVLIVLSTPLATRIIRVDAELDDPEEIDDTSAFDTSTRTLAAGMSADGQFVQVTPQAVCASSALHANFEDTLKQTFDDSTIVAATVVSDLSVVVTAEKRLDAYWIGYYSLPSIDSDSSISFRDKCRIERQPLCVTAVASRDGLLVVAATEDGKIYSIVFDDTASVPSVHVQTISSNNDRSAICDNMAVLQADDASGQTNSMLVCGLRDGKIVTFLVDRENGHSLCRQETVAFGHSTVKLSPLANETSSACAMSGASTCLLKWEGSDARHLIIENIWVSDKDRPEFEQGAIVACGQMPPAALLSSGTLADMLIFVSDDLLVASLDQARTAVPRQIPVTGTPTRLTYAKSLRSLVCAGLHTSLRTHPSFKAQSTPEPGRQIWPVIDFLSGKQSTPSFTHHMQPGERVYSLLEWTFRQNGEKTYTFILVGGSHVKRNGDRRGRITFLQPSIRDWRVTDVKETRIEPFHDDVYALALYDATTYIACAGEHVHVYRLSLDDLRWHSICSPLKLASAGTHITVELNHSGERTIAITTQRDSLIVLRLDGSVAENGASSLYFLVPVVMGPRSEALLTHLMLDPRSAPYDSGNVNSFHLLTTKLGQVIGLVSPKNTTSSARQYTTSQIAFEARLPRSLTRLVPSSPPERKGQPPAGVVPERITASATDGAFVGIILLHPHLWRRLAWLQRLIEWSSELSPHAYQSPIFSPTDEAGLHSRRALPIGFSGHEADAVVMHAAYDRLGDWHADGDVLARVLRKGGRKAVETQLRKLAAEEHAVGIWLKDRLEQEIQNLGEMIDVVRELDEWVQG